MKKLSDVEDKYISGYIEPKGGQCYVCGQMTRVIFVRTLHLPDEFYELVADGEDAPHPQIPTHLSSRLIFVDSKGTQLDRIGIGCGCYARGHRQISHILDHLKAK